MNADTPTGLLVEGDAPVETKAAPRQGIVEIFRDNLFKDLKNSILTLLFGTVIAYLLFRTANYLFITARWEVVRDGPLEFYMVGKDFGRLGISYESLWAGIYVALLAVGIGRGVCCFNRLIARSLCRLAMKSCCC